MGAKLLTKAQREQLLRNGQARQRAEARGEWIDFTPVVKIFTPDAQATWLLISVYPADPTIAFAFCDLGMGFPEFGDVALGELERIRGCFGLPVERDRHFKPEKTISEYAKDARAVGRIVT